MIRKLNCDLHLAPVHTQTQKMVVNDPQTTEINTYLLWQHKTYKIKNNIKKKMTTNNYTDQVSVTPQEWQLIKH